MTRQELITSRKYNYDGKSEQQQAGMVDRSAPAKSQIPLRCLVADRSEAGRRPDSSCWLAARELDDRPNSSSLQVCDQLRTCLRPDSVMEFGFSLATPTVLRLHYCYFARGSGGEVSW